MTDKTGEIYRREQAESIGRVLAAIDDRMRIHGYAGPPGSGLFMLLDTAAAHLGIPRGVFPLPDQDPGDNGKEQAKPGSGGKSK